jgi:hypothetical protein
MQLLVVERPPLQMKRPMVLSHLWPLELAILDPAGRLVQVSVLGV